MVNVNTPSSGTPQKSAVKNKSELVKQADFLTSVHDAIKTIKDPVAFSMGHEKIAVKFGGRELQFTADQLTRFSSRLKLPEDTKDKVSASSRYIKQSVAQNLQMLNDKPEMQKSTEARLYNAQRTKEITGEMGLDETLEFANHVIMPSKKADFKGDYVTCMKTLHDRTQDQTIKTATKKNLLSHYTFDADFEQTFDAVKKPPVDFTPKEKVDMLSWGIDSLSNREQKSSAQVRSGNDRVIDFLLNDKDTELESGELLNRLVTHQADSLTGEFRDTLNGEGNYNDQIAQQQGYLNEMKDMMVKTQARPELQQVFAQKLSENLGNFGSKAMREDAALSVQQMAAGTPAADAAQKHLNVESSKLGKAMTFADNSSNLLRNTYLGDVLGVERSRPKKEFAENVKTGFLADTRLGDALGIKRTGSSPTQNP